MDITKKIDLVLNEGWVDDVTGRNVNETKKAISKGIYNMDGRKIMGERKSKMTLSVLFDDDTLEDMTWKQFKDSKLPWVGGQEKDDHISKKDFLQGMVKQQKQFNKQVDYNTWAKQNMNASWEQKVDMAMKMLGAKYAKRGMMR
jgi:hypothetical protein